MSKLTVLVFKDHLAARSFELHPRWITWFGVWNLTLVVVTAASLTWGIKYRLLVHEMESGQVRPSIETPSAPTPTLAIAPAITESQPIAAPETPKTAPVEEPKPAKPVSVTTSGEYPLWGKWSSKLHAPAATAPKAIQVENVRVKSGAGLARIQFDLLYVKKDGATQQGRIILIGKTAQGFVSYPKSVLAQAKAPDLIQVERGESFSVGRLRPVDAKLETSQAIQEIEILVVDRAGTVLHHMTRTLPKEESDVPAHP